MKKATAIGLLLLLIQFSFTANAQWIESNGVLSGSVRSIKIDGTNIFVSRGEGGVFLSKDNGNSWTPINTGLPADCQVSQFVVNGTNVFAGTQNGIYLTTNNGTTWTHSGLTATDVRSMAANGNTIFAGTDFGGVFLSTNNGNSWTAINNGLPANSHISSIAIDGTNIFIGTYNGIYLSTNNGNSWVAKNNGLTAFTVTSLTISGTNIFAGTRYNGGVFLSTNNGASWKAVNNGLIDNISTVDVLSLAMYGTQIYIGTNSKGILSSIDSGRYWEPVYTDLSYSSRSNVLEIKGSNIFAGTNGGIILSEDNGVTWKELNSGFMPNSAVSSFVFNGKTAYVGLRENGGVNGGVYFSTDNGKTWKGMNSGLNSMPVTALAISGTKILTGTLEGVFSRPINGTKWSILTGHYVHSITVSGTNIFVGTAYGIAVSNDSGITWNNRGPSITIYDVAVSGSNIFAATEFGIYLSTNNGSTWVEKSAGLANSNRALLAAGVKVLSGSYDHGIYVTANNGEFWASSSTGLTNPRIHSLILDGTKIYAGTQGGIFVSSDEGNSWSAINNSGLTNMEVTAVAINGAVMFAGTYRGGAFTNSNSSTVNNINTKNSELIIYPNPASEQLVVETSNSKLKNGKMLEIYSIQGQLLQQISIKETKTILPITHLDKGVYFVKLIKANGIVIFQKFIKA